MNTNNSTPPVKPFIRKRLFDYDEVKFAKTMARMTKELLSEVKVAVWAPISDGKYINLLATDLAGEAFDEVAKKATYTIYEGTPAALRQLGVA